MSSLTRSMTLPFHTDNLMPWLARALETENKVSHAVLRLALGLVLLPHGLQHAFGWFGGYGFAGTMAWMTDTVGIPAPLAGAGIALEVIGPALLIPGIASRLWGGALAIFMAVAASTHVANGFFMNWFGNLPAGSEGFEYHLLAIAMACAIATNGGGAYSVDRVLSRRLQEK